MRLFFTALFGYLLGSVSTGLILTKKKGIDLQKTGSGNIGATNVLRTAGKSAALLTLTGDILKGVLAVTAAKYLFPGKIYEQGLVGLCAIVGHDFSVFSRFRGGKGVATSIGVLGVYSPQSAVLVIIIWLMTVAITKYSSLGALLSFGVLPGIMFFLDRKKLPVALLISVLLFAKHKDNIKRLASGRENKIGGNI